MTEELSGVCENYGNNGEIFTTCKADSEKCEDHSEMVDFCIFLFVLLYFRWY